MMLSIDYAEHKSLGHRDHTIVLNCHLYEFQCEVHQIVPYEVFVELGAR